MGNGTEQRKGGYELPYFLKKAKRIQIITTTWPIEKLSIHRIRLVRK
jgi:hypothetical protein